MLWKLWNLELHKNVYMLIWSNYIYRVSNWVQWQSTLAVLPLPLPTLGPFTSTSVLLFPTVSLRVSDLLAWFPCLISAQAQLNHPNWWPFWQGTAEMKLLYPLWIWCMSHGVILGFLRCRAERSKCLHNSEKMLLRKVLTKILLYSRIILHLN